MTKQQQFYQISQKVSCKSKGSLDRNIHIHTSLKWKLYESKFFFHFPTHFLFNIILNLDEKGNLVERALIVDHSVITQIHIY